MPPPAMDAIVDAHSYQLTWKSLPPLLVTLQMLALATYVLIMNGAQLLRAAFLLACAACVPIPASYAAAAAASSPEVALTLYRLGLALLPTAAAGILAFELLLCQRLFAYRWVAGAALVLGLAQAVPIMATDWYLTDPWLTPGGIYFFHAGPALPLLLGSVILCIAFAIRVVRQELAAEQSLQRCRRIRGSMLSFVVMALGSLDCLLSYGIGFYPLAWLFFAGGSFLLFRSLVTDDLIQASSLDRRLPTIVLYLVSAALGIWAVVQAAQVRSPILMALLIMTVYLGLRIVIALVQIMQRPQINLSDTPLERMLDQYASRVQALREERDIGNATSETLALGLGCERIELLLPSDQNFGWETLDGQVLSEEVYPDPLTLNWLIEHAQPLQRLDVQSIRLPSSDFREPLEALFEANKADVLVPLVHHHDPVGLLMLGGMRGGRALSKEESRFLEQVQEHLTEALAYARMHRRANAKAAMQQEVELAAAVQSAFVPADDSVELGGVQISGLLAYATQCGGDWWSVHLMPDKRVLVLIGDVTGHGVAAAMVTAAAKGCYDVAQRLMGKDVDLGRLLELLDGAVRLVGAGRFNMTCFATLLDPRGGTVEYANAGHVVPYLCRFKEDSGIELGALVARGNPLGAGEEPNHKPQTQSLASGDVLVWYTDGIVECLNPEGEQFGDRRMQRLLRKLDTLESDARAIRDRLVRSVAAFQNGRPADDDITLVVARVK